jgi:secondary thiamine-phosphate synthase enzyme
MEIFTVNTPDRNILINITRQIQDVVSKSGIKDGICYIFIPHTTAGVTINESADPDVRIDITNSLSKMIPPNANYRHSEGNSDSHIKTSFVGPSEMIFIEKGKLKLGTWQGVFLCEFDGPRRREIWIKLVSAE